MIVQQLPLNRLTPTQDQGSVKEEDTYAAHARIASYSVHPWMWSFDSLVRILCTYISRGFRTARVELYSPKAGHDSHVIVAGLN